MLTEGYSSKDSPARKTSIKISVERFVFFIAGLSLPLGREPYPAQAAVVCFVAIRLPSKGEAWVGTYPIRFLVTSTTPAPTTRTAPRT